MASTSRSRPWSDLPTDILLLVFENLKGNLTDLSYSARVCLSWNLVVQTLHPLPTTSPLIAYQSIDTSKQTLCLLNTQTNHTDKLLLPELRGRWVRSFGHDGWLLTIKLKYPYAIQLLNPITGVRINLPSIGKKLSELKKTRIVMSTKSPSDPNCIILASHGFMEDLAFCRPGDLKWTSIGYNTRVEIKDAIFYNGDFYILVMFTQRQVIYIVQMKPNEKSSPILKTFVDVDMVHQYIDNYLVEMMGELLIVSRYSHQIKVHKLEDDKRRWARVINLGKNAIYLAHFSSLSMQASISNDHRGSYISRNIQTGSCIYFLDEIGCYGCDSSVYDMLAYRMNPLAGLSSRSFLSPIGWYF